jgi:hypothetical protein
VENENGPTSPLPSTPPTPAASSGATGSGEWPTVPPVPAPTKPVLVGPEPPIINTDVHLIPSATHPSAPAPLPDLPAAPITSTPIIARAVRRATRPLSVTAGVDDPPLTVLRQSMRRPVVVGRDYRHDLVWQPKFAYTSAIVTLAAFTVVTLPLWIVLYRMVWANDAKVTGIVALVMMLLGAFLTSVTAWIMIIEMRGRVRMVDNLARTGDREFAVAPAAPELPVLDAPVDQVTVRPLRGGWLPGQPLPPLDSRVEAQQMSAAATLEASGRLLGSFSSVLKSFGQLWAQVAMLTVALALFVAATILSLN